MTAALFSVQRRIASLVAAGSCATGSAANAAIGISIRSSTDGARTSGLQLEARQCSTAIQGARLVTGHFQQQTLPGSFCCRHS